VKGEIGISTYIDKNTKKKLDAMSKESDMSIAAILRKALDNLIKQTK
jgi:hypothetical protein